MADLRLRLQGSQAQEAAARAEARRLARELALAHRLLKFSGGHPLAPRPRPAPRPAKTSAEIVRRSAVRLTETVVFHLDSCQVHGTHAAVSGWAFRPAPGWDARATTVTLLFRHGAEVYHAAASPVPRPDVAAHYAAQGEETTGGATGLGSAGFACEILRDSLPAGVDLDLTLRLECAGLACEQPTGSTLRL